MRRLTVEHRTHYRYAEPVSFGPHRLMLRPRDSHRLRLLEAHLTLFPIADVNYVYDVFGNSIALVNFQESADELRIDSVLELEIYPVPPLEDLIAPEASTYPFVYSSDDRLDISLTSARHYTDSGAVEAFARSFLPGAGPMPTIDLLLNINLAIKERFAYAARYEEGTQTPAETLTLASGTCRDFALLFMETVRELGFAARFVTGYLYTPQLDPLAEDEFNGAGATHAWAEVYLPGAGWIDFDPTNGLVGTDHLVRVAVVRDPRQAIPVNGSFSGSAGAFLGMDVEVFVSAHEAPLVLPVMSVPPPQLTARERHRREVVVETLEAAAEAASVSAVVDAADDAQPDAREPEMQPEMSELDISEQDSSDIEAEPSPSQSPDDAGLAAAVSPDDGSPAAEAGEAGADEAGEEPARPEPKPPLVAAV